MRSVRLFYLDFEKCFNFLLKPKLLPRPDMPKLTIDKKVECLDYLQNHILQVLQVHSYLLLLNFLVIQLRVQCK